MWESILSFYYMGLENRILVIRFDLKVPFLMKFQGYKSNILVLEHLLSMENALCIIHSLTLKTISKKVAIKEKEHMAD